MNTNAKTPIRVGVFDQIERANRAIETLIESGFPPERMSVICPECAEDVFPPKVNTDDPAGTHTRDAALAGGAIGAVLGGLTAAVGLAATGGVGLLIAGPLVGATGAGAVTGGFIGAMTSRGFEEEIADFYDQALTRGRILVAVDTTEGEGIPTPETAEHAFEQCGADPIALTRG